MVDPSNIQADIVLDLGTSEHISTNHIHNIEEYYNCWLNKHNLCKEGGLIISENPKTKNWPKHGYNYITTLFVEQLTCYDLIEHGEHAAQNNYTDGWNIYSVLRKTSRPFPTLEQFKTFDIYAQ